METGLQLRDEFGGEITAITFGPDTVQDVLRQKTHSHRVDRTVQIVNPRINTPGSVGSARVLSAAIRKLGQFELIMLR
jgi:electron transfer flavoprotein alpha/beta subunit